MHRVCYIVSIMIFVIIKIENDFQVLGPVSKQMIIPLTGMREKNPLSMLKSRCL